MRTSALPARTAPARMRGFTLLELMLVITVAAVILGLGIPNMTQFIRNNRMTSAANDMLAGLHTARTEAVKRRAFVTFCFSANPTATTPTCNNAGRGWVVFVDDADPAVANGNDFNYAVDANETVLLQHEALPAAITSMNKFPANTQGIIFLPSGFARTTSLPVTGVVLCDSRGNTAVYGAANSAARALVVSAIGRPQVTRATTAISAVGSC